MRRCPRKFTSRALLLVAMSALSPVAQADSVPRCLAGEQ